MADEKTCELIGNSERTHYSGIALKEIKTGEDAGYAVSCPRDVQCPYGLEHRINLRFENVDGKPDFELCPVHGRLPFLDDYLSSLQPAQAA